MKKKGKIITLVGAVVAGLVGIAAYLIHKAQLEESMRDEYEEYKQDDECEKTKKKVDIDEPQESSGVKDKSTIDALVDVDDEELDAEE